MSKTQGDFFEFEKNGLLMQAGKIIYLERFFLPFLIPKQA